MSADSIPQLAVDNMGRVYQPHLDCPQGKVRWCSAPRCAHLRTRMHIGFKDDYLVAWCVWHESRLPEREAFLLRTPEGD